MNEFLSKSLFVSPICLSPTELAEVPNQPMGYIVLFCNRFIMLFIQAVQKKKKNKHFKSYSTVQFSHSVTSDSLQPHGLQHARPPCPSPELTQTHVHWVGDAIQPSHPLSSLLLLPSIFPSIRVFSSESVLCITWPKYWSFSFNISPSNVYSGLISFRIDWLDLLAVQGTLKSLQHHSSKASVLRCLAFFMVQFSHLYMTNGKTIALSRWTFVGKVMSLLFNMLSRFVIAFFPRSKCLLIYCSNPPFGTQARPWRLETCL